MTMDEINKIIAKYDYRLTPALAFSIAFQAAKKERDVCAELCLQGTELPVQTHVLNIIKAERERISNLIKARGRKTLKDMLIGEKHSCPDWDYMVIDEDSPEFESCLCYTESVKGWAGLTEAEIYESIGIEDEFEFAKAIEAKLKEKNT